MFTTSPPPSPSDVPFSLPPPFQDPQIDPSTLLPHQPPPELRLTFTCPSMGVKIPGSYVNDDYCDCPSVPSDEFTTAACSNLSPSIPTFPCANGRGKVYGSRVGDSICDCEDGSDEERGVCGGEGGRDGGWGLKREGVELGTG